MNHVIKYDNSKDVSWGQKKSWCGEIINGFHFTDAQHVALNTSAITPCKDCVNEIIKSLKGDTE